MSVWARVCVCVWVERRSRRELRVIVFVVVILVFVRHRCWGRRDTHHGGVGGKGHGALGLCWSHAAHRNHVAHVHVLRGRGGAAERRGRSRDVLGGVTSIYTEHTQRRHCRVKLSGIKYSMRYPCRHQESSTFDQFMWKRKGCDVTASRSIWWDLIFYFPVLLRQNGENKVWTGALAVSLVGKQHPLPAFSCIAILVYLNKNPAPPKKKERWAFSIHLQVVRI